MTERRFAVSEGGRLVELAESDTPPASSGSLWIDLEDFTEDGLTAWLASAGFSQRAAQAASSAWVELIW